VRGAVVVVVVVVVDVDVVVVVDGEVTIVDVAGGDAGGVVAVAVADVREDGSGSFVVLP